MENLYAEAKKNCVDAISNFKWDVNYHLPGNSGNYDIDWDMSEAEYVGRKIDEVIGIVLSTVMRNHVTLELTDIQRKYGSALKNKQIENCKKILVNAVNELNKVGIVLSRCKF